MQSSVRHDILATMKRSRPNRHQRGPDEMQRVSVSVPNRARKGRCRPRRPADMCTGLVEVAHFPWDYPRQIYHIILILLSELRFTPSSADIHMPLWLRWYSTRRFQWQARSSFSARSRELRGARLFSSSQGVWLGTQEAKGNTCTACSWLHDCTLLLKALPVRKTQAHNFIRKHSWQREGVSSKPHDEWHSMLLRNSPTLLVCWTSTHLTG